MQQLSILIWRSRNIFRQARWNRRRRFSMADIFDMAAERTPLRFTNEGPLASRSRLASHVPTGEQVQEAPPSARAGAWASIPGQEPPAAPEPIPSRAPRKWVRAALAS